MSFALIDCNNFYVSCERAFNPSLEKKPVVVLSNNDGCIISRSNEAKKLNIPMGAPFFKWEWFCKRKSVQVFSSNYELYGDMSQRVMAILSDFNDNIEIYSIDEAFLFFETPPLPSEVLRLRNKIRQDTGIPVSIGIGRTKTLAKVANHFAKTTSDTGVYALANNEDAILTNVPVEKIWGVGYRLAQKLKQLNIETAKKLRDADSNMIRSRFSVSLERTAQELNGVPCFFLSESPPRKQIISSRSFGKTVTTIEDLEEAVSHYTSIAVRKLRKQKSVASALYIFLQTNLFKENIPQYNNGVMYPLAIPSDDISDLITIAKKCVRHLYQKGYQYHKAGIMLLDISPAEVMQYDLFNAQQKRNFGLTETIEHINQHFGKNTVFLAAEGIRREWAIKSNKRSKRYTTRWSELPDVF